MKVIDPTEIARHFRTEIRRELEQLPTCLKLVGFLASDSSPSQTYASYTKAGCDDVGIEFELRRVERLQLEKAVEAANADPSVQGIIVYYPIFGTDHDTYIKDLVDHRKDIEGLNSFWARKLYHNDRFVDKVSQKKAILPCTPLAIVKLLEAAFVGNSAPFAGKTITVFNRSEVVGRPLANMLANDGALVYSFDIDGPIIFSKGTCVETPITRAEALAQSDIVITGVPSRSFPLIQASEIKSTAICVNFSTLKNFEDGASQKSAVFIPRVGPMTVTMALRNTLRLYYNYHSPHATAPNP